MIIIINRTMIIVVKITMIIIGITIISNIANATSIDQIQHQQQIIHQQQEQQRQFEQNKQNLEKTKNIRDRRVVDGVVKDGDDDINKENQEQKPCSVYFSQIILKGNEAYSTKTLNKKITNNFINKCINKTNITELQSKLTNFYINNGYTMARIYFDINNIVYEKTINKETKKEEIKAIFIVIIEEGRINNVKLNIQRERKQTKKEKELEKLYEKYKNLNKNLENSKNQNITDEVQSIQNEIETIKAQLKKLALEVKSESLKNENLSKWKQIRNSMQTAFAFPFKKDRVFNIRDFEQGLDQMNRLQSNSATMTVEPATNNTIISEGYTDITLTNNQDLTKNGVLTGKRTTFITAGVSNSGNKSTGENVINLSLSQDNLISINDNIYISYTDSSYLNGSNKFDNSGNISNKHAFRNSLDFFNNDEEKQKYSKSLYSSLSFPIGYWTINTSLNYSTYKTTNIGQNTIFHTTGQTITQSYSIDKVIYRNKLYKLNMGTILEIRNTESYIRDWKSDTGSRQTSNGSIYLNNTIFTKYGTIIIKPSYQKGLSWFGSKMDEGVYGSKHFKDNEPRLQYDLFKLYVYYNTRISVPLLTKKTLYVVAPSSSAVVPDSSAVVPTSPFVIPANAGIQKQDEDCSDNNLNSCIRRNDEGEKWNDGEEKWNDDRRDRNNEGRKGNNESGSKNKNASSAEPIKIRNKLPITYTLTIDSQYSFDTLYAKDQFSVGGEYTIRGFRESAISGDNGFYIRNDIKVNMFQLMLNFITGSGKYKNNSISKLTNYNSIFLSKESLNSLLSKTYFSIFYDYGYVRNKYNDDLQREYNSRSGIMSGFGVELNYYGDYLNWSLVYSKAINSPNYLEFRDGIKKENHSVYWKFGINW